MCVIIFRRTSGTNWVPCAVRNRAVQLPIARGPWSSSAAKIPVTDFISQKTYFSMQIMYPDDKGKTNVHKVKLIRLAVILNDSVYYVMMYIL